MNANQVASFQRYLRGASRLVVLTGAGVSAESGIPTFRGSTAAALWRGYEGPDISNPQSWKRNPGFVWEFFSFRRRIVRDKTPNTAHIALAEIEARFTAANRQFHLITQNIDDLHFAAGSKHVTRLHGSLWQVRCTSCGAVAENRDVPITPAFEGRDGPEDDLGEKLYEHADLPQCSSCRGLVRPHVVWFGEQLDLADLGAAERAAKSSDVFVIVGTSSMVFPAALFAPIAKRSGAVVAEINLEETQMTEACDFAFHGKAGEILPQLFATDIA